MFSLLCNSITVIWIKSIVAKAINFFFFTPGSESRVCLLVGTRKEHEDALILIGHIRSRATLEPTLHQTRVKTQVSRVETVRSVLPWNSSLDSGPGCERENLFVKVAIKHGIDNLVVHLQRRGQKSAQQQLCIIGCYGIQFFHWQVVPNILHFFTLACSSTMCPLYQNS